MKQNKKTQERTHLNLVNGPTAAARGVADEAAAREVAQARADVDGAAVHGAVVHEVAVVGVERRLLFGGAQSLNARDAQLVEPPLLHEEQHVHVVRGRGYLGTVGGRLRGRRLVAHEDGAAAHRLAAEKRQALQEHFRPHAELEHAPQLRAAALEGPDARGPAQDGREHVLDARARLPARGAGLQVGAHARVRGPTVLALDVPLERQGLAPVLGLPGALEGRQLSRAAALGRTVDEERRAARDGGQGLGPHVVDARRHVDAHLAVRLHHLVHVPHRRVERAVDDGWAAVRQVLRAPRAHGWRGAAREIHGGVRVAPLRHRAVDGLRRPAAARRPKHPHEDEHLVSAGAHHGRPEVLQVTILRHAHRPLRPAGGGEVEEEG
jgi:hypothetical protein